MLLDVKKPKASRTALIKSDTSDAFQQLLQDYWTWHYNDSLHNAVKLLLSADLGWEQVPQLHDTSRWRGNFTFGICARSR